MDGVDLGAFAFCIALCLVIARPIMAQFQPAMDNAGRQFGVNAVQSIFAGAIADHDLACPDKFCRWIFSQRRAFPANSLCQQWADHHLDHGSGDAGRRVKPKPPWGGDRPSDDVAVGDFYCGDKSGAAAI